ncbi:hypothetical protein GE21DRAFT_1113369 [Neurospora crassa]|nr:hypothetical protein GE21DRAFT_1113369 [Neurospora crassa]
MGWRGTHLHALDLITTQQKACFLKQRDSKPGGTGSSRAKQKRYKASLVSVTKDCVFRPRASFMTHNVCPAPAIFMENHQKKTRFPSELANFSFGFSSFSSPLCDSQVTPCPYLPRMSGTTDTEVQSCRVNSRYCLLQTPCIETCCTYNLFFFSRPFVVMCLLEGNKSEKKNKSRWEVSRV